MDYSLMTLFYGMKFRKLLEKLLKPIEDEYGLNKVDLQILFYLYSAKGRNTSKDIMELKMFTRGHISQSLGRLQQKGYVVIRQDTQDRRCTHNDLTQEVETLVEKISIVFHQVGKILMEGVTEKEQEYLGEIAGKVNKNIDRAISS